MLRQRDRQAEQAAKTAARLELLLNEEPGLVTGLVCICVYVWFVCRYVEGEGLERTFRYQQQEMAAVLPLANRQHYFDLKLEQLGPYSISYSRNGR